jgi:hypothetical protein
MRNLLTFSISQMLEVPNLLQKDRYQDDMELSHWYL